MSADPVTLDEDAAATTVTLTADAPDDLAIDHFTITDAPAHGSKGTLGVRQRRRPARRRAIPAPRRWTYTPDADTTGRTPSSSPPPTRTPATETSTTRARSRSRSIPSTTIRRRRTMPCPSTRMPVRPQILVLANDCVRPGRGETLAVSGVTDPDHGTASFVAGSVSYTPDPAYFGTDSFAYTLCGRERRQRPRDGERSPSTLSTTPRTSPPAATSRSPRTPARRANRGRRASRRALPTRAATCSRSPRRP